MPSDPKDPMRYQSVAPWVEEFVKKEDANPTVEDEVTEDAPAIDPKPKVEEPVKAEEKLEVVPAVPVVETKIEAPAVVPVAPAVPVTPPSVPAN